MKPNPFRICLAVPATVLLALATVPPAGADYSNTVVSLNPIAYYRLNETTPVPADTAANLGTAGLIGTALYINSPTHQVTPGALVGSTDTAVGFSGSATTKDRVATPFNSSINPTGPFSTEAWVQPGISGGTYCALSYFTEAGGGAPGRTGWLIYEMAGGWNFRMYNGVSSAQIVDITGGGVPDVSQWYHLVAVYDGTNAAFYVNGALAGQQLVVGYAPNVGAPFSIGARADGNFWFTGSADEVALYASALSAGDILAHYQNGTNASPSQSYNSLVLANNPILYYRLDESDFAGGTPVTAANLGNLGVVADGTYEAGAVTGVAGVPFAGFGAGNKAMSISSLAGDVVIEPQSINTDQFTITCWFKRSGLHASGQALVFNRTSGTATGLGFGYDSSPKWDELNVHWNEGPSSWLTGLIPPNDVWCFGAAVYSPTNVTVYLDDLSTNLNTTLTAHDFSIVPIYIGWDSAYPRFSGSIDEVALFDRALSPAEVLSIFTASQMPGQVLGITRTPADPLFEGYNIAMTATTAGIPPLTNQWYKNNTLLPGKTNLTLSFPNAAVTNSGNYTLVVANAYGSTTSAVQQITVSAGPPLFLSQSITNATRAIGGRVTYSVVAGGSAPVSYQWNHDSTPIPGATNSVLKLMNLQLTDQGSYTVTLTNPYGTNSSSASGTVSVFTVTNYAFAAMYGNPLAYYRLNETSGTAVADYANGLTGTTISSVVLGDPGPQPPTWAGLESTNTAFGFDGSSTRVQLPSFNLQTNQMTIVAWINPAGPQSDQTGILVSRSSTGLGGFFVNRNGSDALSYVWEGTGSWDQFKSGLVPVIGQWNFVALVIDPLKGTVYLDSADGTGLQSASFVPPEGNKTVPWDSPNIGVDLGYPRWFNGSIDEVVVYDRALSPTEITNLDLLGTAWPGPAPQIVQQPSAATVNAGEPASFTVAVLGGVPFAYQWQHAGTNLPGAIAQTLTIPSAQFTDAGTYRVGITNSVGGTNSLSVTLTVVPPAIVAQPAPQTVFAGQSVSFSVAVAGGAPHTYQWQHAGTNVPGATAQTLTIPSAYYTDAGAYTVTVTNSVGSPLTSQPATLTVLAPPLFANLTNGLVLHLAFDGNYNDSSGRGNNASAVNSPTFVPGKLNTAFHYNTDFNNGIVNYATLGSPTPTDLLFGTSQNFSVSYWIRFTGASVDLPVISNNDCGEGCIGFYFGPSVINSQGAWAWSLCNSSYVGPIAEGAANSINNGDWHNVVTTIDRAGSAITYLDGVMVNARPIITFTDDIDTANPINIGQVGTAGYGAGVVFAADVDDLGIWRRVLSSTEAESIYMVGQQNTSFDTYGPVILSLSKAGNDIQLVWQTGTLQQSDKVNGVYSTVPGATAPYYRVTPGATPNFYRVTF